LLEVLPAQLGMGVYLLAAAGLVFMAREPRTRRYFLFISTTLLAFLLPIGYLTRATWRDILPILPVLAITAGHGLDHLLGVVNDPIGRDTSGWRTQVLSVLPPLLILGGPFWNVVQHHRLRLGTDTRDLASSWIESHISGGSHLAIETYGPAVLDEISAQKWPAVEAWLDGEHERVDRPVFRISILQSNLSDRRDLIEPDQLLPFLRDEQVQYVVVSSAYYYRFYNPAVDLHFPDLAVRGRRLHDLLATNLEVVAEFVPNWHDRPGPLIRIYRVPDDFSGWKLAVEGVFEPFPGMDRPAAAVGYYQFHPNR
jgi:hypothetical protein